MKNKSTSQRKQKRKVEKFVVEGKSGLPKSQYKRDCIYINGVIDHMSHGFFRVELENGMRAMCTARRMENVKVLLLLGDNVVCEIPTNTINPNEVLKGRIVWRNRTFN